MPHNKRGLTRLSNIDYLYLTLYTFIMIIHLKLIYNFRSQPPRRIQVAQDISVYT